MFKWIMLLGAALIVLSFVIGTDAMTRCQENNSFETCFRAING